MTNSKQKKECLLFADIGKSDGHQVEGDGAHMGPLAKLSSLRFSFFFLRKKNYLSESVNGISP